MRRGELRRYVRPSSPDVSRLVVILSSDSLNSSARPWVLGLGLQQRDSGDILAIPVAGHGWAYVRDLTQLYRPGSASMWATSMSSPSPVSSAPSKLPLTSKAS